jgi:predicted MFS family arabinose efflux permease
MLDTPTRLAPNPVRPVARVRTAIVAVFFINGLTLSTLIARAPSLKAGHHLDNAQVGFIDLLFGLAAIAAMQFVAPLVGRFGSRRVLHMALSVMPLALVAVGLTRGVIDYAIATMVLGAAHGTTDSAMNAHAVAVERATGRPVLNSCHGAWSVSAIAASLVTALVVHARVTTLANFAGVAVVVLIAGLVVARDLLARDADATDVSSSVRQGWRTGWTRMVVLLGVTGMLLMVCEGAALGWGGILLHDDKGAPVALASIAVTAYALGQTAGRAVGDRLRQRFPVRSLFRGGGLLGAVGVAVAVSCPRPLFGIVGLAVFGLGASLLLPLTFGAVGHAGGSGAGAATFISRFTTFTYAGVLLGPGLIGWAADAMGLTATLAVLVPVLVVVAIAGSSIVGAQEVR